MTLHEPTTPAFKANARAALGDKNLQSALRNARGNFVLKRAKARAGLPEFEALRERGRAIKDHTLRNLDLYLDAYERQVVASGGVVHWAETAGEARAIVLDICRKAGARTVNKGKTMISEECGINGFLAENGITPVETDLGEYIIQLRGEPPSHIIAPAVHVTVPEVQAEFRRAHTHLAPDRDPSELGTLLAEARGVLREKYFAAEVGITGANMLIAETGHSVIVTNEGNGDLSQSLPKVHIVMASLEKVVPTLEDASTILRLLARSATGQEMTVYTTFSRGPRRAGDPDGPEEYHVVLLDNGRSSMLGGEFQDMLRCIRCGACMNHCPVYQAVGGHAYGWVYPGPMGAVLTPSLIGVEKGGQLPNASTFCGRCEAVCPMMIPLAPHDAPLARARVRAAPDARFGATRARSVGVGSAAAAALSAGGASRQRGAPGARRRAGTARAAAVGGRLDRASGTCPRRRGRPSWTNGGGRAGERARADPRAGAGDGRRGATGRPRWPRGWRSIRRGSVPHHAQSHGPGRLRQFMAKLEAASGTVGRVSELAELPKALAHELRKRNLPAAVRTGEDPIFQGLVWGTVETSRGPGRLVEPATLSRAEFGLAETGSLVLASGRDNPVTLTFLGETHFVALREGGRLRRLRGLLGRLADARARSAHDQPRHRAFALGGHRAGAAARRPRADRAARVSRPLNRHTV